jgi:hypothetical protein
MHTAQLIDLRDNYLKNEKIKLADELRNDIIYQAYLIQAVTDVEWDAVANELSTRKYPWWIKEHFRHLDILAKERDEAVDLLKSITSSYSKALIDLGISNQIWQFPLDEIENFLDYCTNEGLSLFVTAASGMIATEQEYTKKFRRVSRYTNLKNILTSLDYLLMKLAQTRPYTKVTKRPGLNSLIKAVMGDQQKWISLFKKKEYLTNPNGSTEFLTNLTKLINDPELLQSEDTYWAREFLIASLGRNLTVHNYLTEDWFYGELFGELLRSAIYTTLYVWELAKKEKWI